MPQLLLVFGQGFFNAALLEREPAQHFRGPRHLRREALFKLPGEALDRVLPRRFECRLQPRRHAGDGSLLPAVHFVHLFCEECLTAPRQLLGTRLDERRKLAALRFHFFCGSLDLRERSLDSLGFSADRSAQISKSTLGFGGGL